MLVVKIVTLTVLGLLFGGKLLKKTKSFDQQMTDHNVSGVNLIYRGIVYARTLR